MQLSLEPFPYLEYFNFFTDQELEQILNQSNRAEEIDQCLSLSNTDKDFFVLMQDKAWTIAKDYNILLEHTPHPHNKTSAKPEDCYFKIQLKKLKPGFSYRIHADSHTKHMTSVFYISDTGKGTDVYDNDKNWHSNITWKKNKGYSFIPHVHSYHSYEHPIDFIEPRITIMFIYQNKRFYN